METKKIKNIIFWQICPSIHQASYIKNIQKYVESVTVTCVFIGNIDSRRVNMGWSLPDYGNVNLLYKNNKSQIQDMLNGNDESSVHIFSGISNSKLIKYAFKLASNNRNYDIGILSEGYKISGVRGVLKIARRIINDISLYKDVDFVLAIGSKASEWYRSCGIANNKIFSFPYVVDCTFDTKGKTTENSFYRIIFVGALIKRKNVAHLLYSLAQIMSRSWSLDIVGDGPEKEKLKCYAKKLGVSDNVNFVGVLDNKSIRDYISEHDLLVLPSFWDGWGAVVNEAISAGVPVICSDRCGAKDLIHPGKNGDIFQLSNKSSLYILLQIYLAHGPINNEARLKIKIYSESVSGRTIACYFVDILTHVLVSTDHKQQPVPPWVNAVGVLNKIV